MNKLILLVACVSVVSMAFAQGTAAKPAPHHPAKKAAAKHVAKHAAKHAAKPAAKAKPKAKPVMKPASAAK